MLTEIGAKNLLAAILFNKKVVS